MIKEVKDGELLLAIIVSGDFKSSGINFFTSNEFSQQLAYMNHPAGKIIQPHKHNPVAREVVYTQEVLFIKKGKLRVDFYNREEQYLYSLILQAGDVIFLVTGGHGFEILEDLEMFEVKQGPYMGDSDKTRFTPVSDKNITIVDWKSDDPRQ